MSLDELLKVIYGNSRKVIYQVEDWNNMEVFHKLDQTNMKPHLLDVMKMEVRGNLIDIFVK